MTNKVESTPSAGVEWVLTAGEEVSGQKLSPQTPVWGMDRAGLYS